MICVPSQKFSWLDRVRPLGPPQVQETGVNSSSCPAKKCRAAHNKMAESCTVLSMKVEQEWVVCIRVVVKGQRNNWLGSSEHTTERGNAKKICHLRS